MVPLPKRPPRFGPIPAFLDFTVEPHSVMVACVGECTEIVLMVVVSLHFVYVVSSSLLRNSAVFMMDLLKDVVGQAMYPQAFK